MVWGAGGGIGRALVQALHDEGWQVLAVVQQDVNLALPTPHCPGSGSLATEPGRDGGQSCGYGNRSDRPLDLCRWGYPR